MSEDVKYQEAYVDGSSTGMYGYYLVEEKETFIVKDQPTTNNQAEWLALYTLILDLPQGWKGRVFSDSLLVVNQYKGEYAIRDPELKRIHDSCKTIAFQKKLSLSIEWVPREKNIVGKKLDRELAKERKKRWQRKEVERYRT